MIKSFISIVSAILLLSVFTLPLQALASGSDGAGSGAKSAVKQKVSQKAGAKAPGPATMQNSGPAAAKPGMPASPGAQGGSMKGPAVSPQKKIPTGPGQSTSSQVIVQLVAALSSRRLLRKRLDLKCPLRGCRLPLRPPLINSKFLYVKKVKAKRYLAINHSLTVAKTIFASASID